MNLLRYCFPKCLLPGISAALLAFLPAYAQKPGGKAEPKSATPTENAAQIELLDTRYRFEAYGDSRKEVHARVKINSELGAQQFARLNFDYNRSFQSVEIPFVRITHPSGGTAEILPSAITDNPNPAIVNYPAYQDVRVKSVRILGLAPGDILEYCVVTKTMHPPLAPDFWLDHSFDRTGVVSEEAFELDLPSHPQVRMRINPATPANSSPDSSAPKAERIIYRWSRKHIPETGKEKEELPERADVQVSTFSSWSGLADRLGAFLIPSEEEVRALHDRAVALTSPDASSEQKASDIYDFVSKKIRTLDLPLGATGFRVRKPGDVLSSGYGTEEEKFVLFAALATNFLGPARAGLVSGSSQVEPADLPALGPFDHLLTMSGYPSVYFWLDLNVEVAPFRMIPTQFRRKPVLVIGPAVENRWQTVEESFPFPSSQKVNVQAELDADGKLTAKVSYTMRGDNELLLRLAFHQAPKEKWKDVAQLLALSDGFRGKVASANASDPYDTKDPFSVEYEVEQPKFVNWEKRPVRIPAILPLVGLPDTPATDSKLDIDLGTPLNVELHATLKLPPGASARVPPGTAVTRDYAEFSSNYSAQGETIAATRKIRFVSRSLSATRAADYNAFVHAVQNDQAQEFTLDRRAPKTSTANLAQH